MIKSFSQRFLVKVNFFVEKKPGVTDVRLLDRQPAEKHIIFTWEQVRHFTVFDNLVTIIAGSVAHLQ